MNVLTEQEANYLMDLLPQGMHGIPKIYIVEKWKQVLPRTENRNLYQEYTVLRNIVTSRIFSSYNYQFQTIFIYLFNLPYEDHNLKKLHAIFCLYHELRHHHQYMSNPDLFFSHLPQTESYNHAWTEKDANEFAASCMRKNRALINQRLDLEGNNWEIGIHENRLRIYYPN